MEKDKRCVIFIYTQQGFLNWRDELEALSVFFKELIFFLSALSPLKREVQMGVVLSYCKR